jgi:type IV secretion system protein VirB6
MFSWIGTKFDAVLSTYVLDVVSSLMTGIAPIALTALTIWVFVWKVVKIGLVLAISLQSAVYVSNVAETANALATGVATTFLPSAADPTTITSPYALLDAFNDKASKLTLDLLKEAGITRLELVFAAVVCSIGNVVFLCVALFVVSLAKLLMTFVIAVGPIFILCLAWRPTVRFFDSWLSMVLNAVVLTWFVFFALGLSVYLGDAIVQAINDQGGMLGPTFNVVGESLKYCIAMVLMAIICFQAPSLAAALTGGAVVQQGIQMVQNALMVSGLRSANSARSGATTAGTGGVIRAGAGVPYAAGRATAAVATTGARFANAAAAQGTRAVRLAAYRLAALRGRSQ